MFTETRILIGFIAVIVTLGLLVIFSPSHTNHDDEFDVAVTEVGMAAGVAEFCRWTDDKNRKLANDFIATIRDSNRQKKLYDDLGAGISLGVSVGRHDNKCFDTTYQLEVGIDTNQYQRLLITNTHQVGPPEKMR